MRNGTEVLSPQVPDAELLAFLRGVDAYKRAAGQRFPALSELLELAHALGWRRVAEPTAIPKRRYAPRDRLGE